MMLYGGKLKTRYPACTVVKIVPEINSGERVSETGCIGQAIRSLVRESCVEWITVLQGLVLPLLPTLLLVFLLTLHELRISSLGHR